MMRVAPVRVAAFLVAAMIAIPACHALRAGSADPHVDEVRPDSVQLDEGAVVHMTIRGHGFSAGSPGQNTVQFGEVTLTSVPANDDGTEIQIVVPQTVPSRGEAAPLPLEAGTYAVSVRTAAGTSNAVNVRVGR